jgi:hypothetical protein
MESGARDGWKLIDLPSAWFSCIYSIYPSKKCYQDSLDLDRYGFGLVLIFKVWFGRYVESLAQFGGQVEVRTARHTQHLPLFLRMLGKKLLDTQCHLQFHY